MSRKIDTTKLQKLNMGGEIRGYSGVEPPKTPPVEETTGMNIPLHGAGDAVKSGYADIIGAKSALQSYQKGGEADPREDLGSLLKPSVSYTKEELAANERERRDAKRLEDKPDYDSLEQMEQAARAKLMQQAQTQVNFPADTPGPSYTKRFEELTTGNIYSRQKQFIDRQTGQTYDFTPSKAAAVTNYESVMQRETEKEKALLKQRYGDDFNEQEYDFISKMSAEERENYLGEDINRDKNSWTYIPGQFEKAISTADMYGRFNTIQQAGKQMEANKETFNRDTFDAVLQRMQLKGRLEEVSGNANLSRNLRMEELEGLSALTPAESTELQDLKSNEVWDETSAELYEAIHDLDRRLNFQGEYDESKFTQSTQWDKNIQQKTGAANEWLSHHLGFIGEMLGETVVSGGDLIRPGGSAAKFWEALSDDQQGSLKQASLDLGYDLFNVLSLLTVAGGAAGAGVRTLLVQAGKMSTKASMRGLVKSSLKKGLGALKNQWGSMSGTKRWAMMSAPGLIAGAQYGVGTMMGQNDPKADIARSMNEAAAKELYGIDYQEEETLKRLKRSSMDPTESYSDIGEFLDKTEFGTIADAYEYYHPGEVVPEEYLMGREIKQQEQEQETLLASMEGIDVSNETGAVPEKVGSKSIAKSKDVDVSLEGDLNSAADSFEEVALELGYSAEDERRAEQARSAMSKFKTQTAENKFYDYLRR